VTFNYHSLSLFLVKSVSFFGGYGGAGAGAGKYFGGKKIYFPKNAESRIKDGLADSRVVIYARREI
jgi:hypothetical protein